MAALYETTYDALFPHPDGPAARFYELRFRPPPPPGTDVFVSGAFNAWSPAPGEPFRARAPGWAARVPVAGTAEAGVLRFKWRVGGRWEISEGFGREDDGFGGWNNVAAVGELPVVGGEGEAAREGRPGEITKGKHDSGVVLATSPVELEGKRGAQDDGRGDQQDAASQTEAPPSPAPVSPTFTRATTPPSLYKLAPKPSPFPGALPPTPSPPSDPSPARVPISRKQSEYELSEAERRELAVKHELWRRRKAEREEVVSWVWMLLASFAVLLVGYWVAGWVQRWR
ncbi:hypothetical protein DFJ74DRAFT_665578 [Hyaloraphidium curvatum]|nr:hypothetical protein DFJ74DRAFT_665578 [Hyaloraphidium curvatum]